MREWWLVSIYKEIENFLQNMAIEDADPSLVVKWKTMGKWATSMPDGLCVETVDTVTTAGQ